MGWFVAILVLVLPLFTLLLAMVTGLIREKTGAESAADGYLKSWLG